MKQHKILGKKLREHKSEKQEGMGMTMAVKEGGGGVSWGG
jgi:hypothetical protein